MTLWNRRSLVSQKGSASFLTPILDICLSMTIITLSPSVLTYLEYVDRANENLPTSLPSPDQIDSLRAIYEELWRRYLELAAQLRQKPSGDQLPQVDMERLRKIWEELMRVIEALRQEIGRLQNQQESHHQQDAQTQKRLQELRTLLEELQKKIAEAEKQLQHLRYTREQLELIKKLKEQIESLKRELEKERQREKDLNEKIAKALRKLNQFTVAISAHPRVKRPEDLRPKYVIISKARITPIEEPYYVEEYDTISLGDLVLKRLKLRFVREGPPASETLEPGSEFGRWLEGIDPHKHYVLMFVTADSFETFRLVRDQLRKRGILCGWQPDPVGNEDIYPRPGGPQQPRVIQ